MKSTSLHAFYHTVLPTLPTRKAQIKKVVEMFKDTGITQRAVAKILNVPIHTISGRFGELERDGEIQVMKDDNGENKVEFYGQETMKGRQPHNLYVPCQT